MPRECDAHRLPSCGPFPRLAGFQECFVLPGVCHADRAARRVGVHGYADWRDAQSVCRGESGGFACDGIGFAGRDSDGLAKQRGASEHRWDGGLWPAGLAHADRPSVDGFESARRHSSGFGRIRRDGQFAVVLAEERCTAELFSARPTAGDRRLARCVCLQSNARDEHQSDPEADGHGCDLLSAQQHHLRSKQPTEPQVRE